MKNKQHRELAVCGFEAVRALAACHPERIQRLFFNKDRARFFGDICRSLAASRRVYRLVETDDELEKLCQSVHHQGVVAMIDFPQIPRLEQEQLETWALTGEQIVALDRVGNANNLGAIVRSAAFFGICNLIISDEDEQADVTTSTWRVAQGGMEYVNIWRVSSMSWLSGQCAGRITRIGADHRARNRLRDLPSLAPSGTAVVVILGNEETGLSAAVKDACDHLVRIPGSGDIESLNVAQAASLFLYELAAR